MAKEIFVLCHNFRTCWFWQDRLCSSHGICRKCMETLHNSVHAHAAHRGRPFKTTAMWTLLLRNTPHSVSDLYLMVGHLCYIFAYEKGRDNKVGRARRVQRFSENFTSVVSLVHLFLGKDIRETIRTKRGFDVDKCDRVELTTSVNVFKGMERCCVRPDCEPNFLQWARIVTPVWIQTSTGALISVWPEKFCTFKECRGCAMKLCNLVRTLLRAVRTSSHICIFIRRYARCHASAGRSLIGHRAIYPWRLHCWQDANVYREATRISTGNSHAAAFSCGRFWCKGALWVRIGEKWNVKGRCCKSGSPVEQILPEPTARELPSI